MSENVEEKRQPLAQLENKDLDCLLATQIIVPPKFPRVFL